MIIAKRTLSLLPAMVLAGCISLVPEPGDVVIYDLRAPARIVVDLPPATYQLVVERPVASSALDSVRIVTMDGRALRYIAGVAWPDPATRVVQSLLVESLENSGVILGISRDEVGAYGQVRVKGELRELGIDNGVARVGLYLQVIREPRARIMAARSFQAQQRPDGTDANALVMALETATQQLLGEAVPWILQNAAIEP